ncbi:hypothetical protein [Nesterenkonia muleiensis]|uniref:hypothetical protein n=1 Tax=Nesterenkonia muleiensis TaxID=2282648 RepID=UPI0013005773|nr:hypothetical protein [Nesterenkonia muleiensis]
MTTRPVARRKRRRRALVALGVTTALVAGASYGTWQYIEENEFLLDERCEVAVGEDVHELPPNRAHHAAVLAASSVDRGLPPEAAVHALAISLQETELALREAGEAPGEHVLFARGAPDWSSGSEVQQVAVTVDGFFDVLEDSWNAGHEEEDDEDSGEDSESEEETFWNPDMPLDETAEILQRPHNPQFYPRHSSMAQAFAWPLTGQTGGPDMTCYISQLEVPGPDPSGVADELASVLPRALDIPFTAPEEDGENGDDEDGEEFVPEPILEGIIEVTEADGEPLVYVALPESDGASDYQWMLAHWAITAARDYGIQSVTSAPYRWDRDSARWNRLDEEAGAATPSGTVLIGFTRES